MANRYWVGGTNTWNATAGTKWALTSGGAGGEAVPTSADDVFIDGNSGTGVVSIATATTNCLSLNFTGFTGSFGGSSSGSSTIYVYGDLTLGAGMTMTFIGGWQFKSTSGTRTITSNGKIINALVFDGVGGTWQLADDLQSSGSGYLYLANGTFNANNFNVTCNRVNTYQSTNSRTLLMGSGTWTITGANGWDSSTITGLTFNVGTSTININGQFQGGGLTYNIVNFLGTSNSIYQTNTFSTLTISPTTPQRTDSLLLYANQTVTTNLTISDGATLTNRVLVRSSTAGYPITITCTGASVNYSNVDFMDITIVGGTLGTNSSVGDCGGNTGITFTAAVDQHWTYAIPDSAVALWSVATSWTSRVPLPQDNVFFNFSFGTNCSISVVMPRLGKNITWTGATWTTSLTWSFGQMSVIFGNIVLAAGLTVSGSTPVMSGRGSSSITSNTSSFSGNGFNIDVGLGTVSLLDDFSYTGPGALGMASGSFDANNKNLLISALSYSSTAAKTLSMGSGTWTLTKIGTIWWAPPSLTIYPETSLIKVTNNTNSSVSFLGGDKTYNNIWFSRGLSTGANNITGSNIFNDFKDDGSVAHSLVFTHGTTQHVTTFNVNGSAGKEITINSETAATHSLVKDGGGTITANYLNIQHSVVTPTLTWLATNSTNNQATATAGSGWYFDTFPQNISVVDNLNISENVSRSKQSFIGVFDQVNISGTTVLGEVLVISVVENINLSDTESTTAPFSALSPSIINNLTLRENISISPLFLPTIGVFDSLSISESITVRHSLNISLTDSIQLSDSPVFESVSTINKTENITITENRSIGSPELIINTSNSLNLSENSSILFFVEIVKSESLSISEGLTVRVSMGNIVIYNQINLSENTQRELFDNVTLFDSLSLVETLGFESFRFAPSPGGSQPQGSSFFLEPVASAGKGSFINPVGSIGRNSSGRPPIGGKGLSL